MIRNVKLPSDDFHLRKNIMFFSVEDKRKALNGSVLYKSNKSPLPCRMYLLPLCVWWKGKYWWIYCGKSGLALLLLNDTLAQIQAIIFRCLKF